MTLTVLLHLIQGVRRLGLHHALSSTDTARDIGSFYNLSSIYFCVNDVVAAEHGEHSWCTHGEPTIRSMKVSQRRGDTEDSSWLSLTFAMLHEVCG